MSNAALAAADFFGDIDDIFLAEDVNTSVNANTDVNTHANTYVFTPVSTSLEQHTSVLEVVLEKYGYDSTGVKQRSFVGFRLSEDVLTVLKQRARDLHMSQNSALCAAVELFLHITHDQGT